MIDKVGQFCRSYVICFSVSLCRAS